MAGINGARGGIDGAGGGIGGAGGSLVSAGAIVGSAAARSLYGGASIARASGIIRRTTTGVALRREVLASGGLVVAAGRGRLKGLLYVFVSNGHDLNRRNYRIIRTARVPSYSIVILAEFQIVMTTAGFHLLHGTTGPGP